VFIANSSFNHQFPYQGKHDITLVVTDENQCFDTITKPVRLYKPQANFTVDTIRGCVPFQPQFTDATQSDTTLSQWIWTLATGQQSLVQNPVGVYNPNVTRWFDVSMIAVDVLGCSDTVLKSNFVQAIRPPLNMIANQQLCEGDSNYFENLFHQQGTSYFWDFGNGSTSLLQNPG